MKKKRCKVIMLPTDKPTLIVKFKMFGKDKINYSKVVLPIQDEEMYQHLYIISDDKIEAGDWCLFFWDGNKEGELGQIGSEPQQYFPENGHTLNKNLRKIIATTNPELKIERSVEGITDGGRGRVFREYNPLPQPSQSFIEEYCRKGGIDEVDVEYAVH